MNIRWNETKNKRLKRIRGVSFEEILKENLVKIMSSPTHLGQNWFLYERKGYIWVVPYVVDSETKGIFLKTLYPSRKHTKQYRRGELL